MINIAKTIYAGYDTSGVKYDLPIAEIMPLGNTSSETKKLTMLTHRSHTLTEYENTPMPGFTLYKSDRKSWGSLELSWLVIDPRGFLVRITSGNLENILHVTGITEGLIQQKCVWARNDSDTKMSLIPVNSSTYLEAVENSELIENKVSMKDVNIGDTVLLQNKLVGVYRGVASLYCACIGYYNLQADYKVKTFLRRQIIEVSNGKYHHQSDLKILKILKKTNATRTRDESIKDMNDDILTGNATFNDTANMTSTYHSGRYQVRLVSAYAVPHVEMTYSEIDITEAADIVIKSNLQNDASMLVVENHRGDRFLIDTIDTVQSLQGTKHHGLFKLLTIQHCSSDSPMYKIILLDKQQQIRNVGQPPTFTLDMFSKFYKIVKHVKHLTYI